MADPTGTAGSSSSSRIAGAESDLALATSGGVKFMQRLHQLGEAADRLEQAAAKAGFGNDIAGALRQAESKLSDAEQSNRLARANLEDTNARAKAIVDQANKRASEVSKAALAAGAGVEAEAARVRTAADAYAAKTKGDADTIRQAVAAQRAAEARGRDVDGKLSRLNAALHAML